MSPAVEQVLKTKLRRLIIERRYLRVFYLNARHHSLFRNEITNVACLHLIYLAYLISAKLSREFPQQGRPKGVGEK